MEILFKNVTTLNKDEYIELIKFHGQKNNFKYYLYTAIMGLILIIGMSYQIILRNYISLTLLALIFIGFLAYRFIEPYRKAEKEMKGEKVQGNLVNTYIFYDKNFVIKNKYGKDTFKYRKLFKVYENKNVFYLYINKEDVFIVEKNKFEIGNPYEFKEFIAKKVGYKFKNYKK